MTGSWSGKVGPLPVRMEIRRNGDYLEAVNRIELPWMPADVVAGRMNLETGKFEMHMADQGWTNLRWEPGSYLITPEDDLLIWHYEGMNVMRLKKD